MGARLNLTLTEKPDSIDVVKNTSVVEALLTITTDRGTYNLSGDTSGSIVVNGKTTSLNGEDVYLETTTTLYYEEIEVQHDADGRKTVTASASFDVNTAVRWVYASATLELTKIPRASALLFEAITLGESCEISIERAVSGFKDTISYAFGTASGTIVELPTSAPEVIWTPPIELAAEIPNSPSGTGVFTVTTYDASGTEIGKKETPFSASVPKSLKPDVFPEISDERGYFDIYGSYVQTQSRLKVVARGAGIYGSTIDAWKINIDGVGYSNESVTVDLLSSNNALPVSVAVRDTRGQWSDDVKTTIKVLPYIAPTVTQIVAGRYDPEKKVMAEDGAQVAVKFSAVVTALEGQNSAAYHIKIREKGAASWRTVETLEGEGYTPGDVLVVIDSETTKAYELMVTAEDDFQSRDSVVKAVPIAFVFFHWSAVRRAFAFFQKAVEDATFRIAEGMAVRLPKDTKVGEMSVLEHFKDVGNPHSVTALQVGAIPAVEDTSYPGCYYRMAGSVKEWINPPMVPGVEYRTTDRFNGVPVYTKLISTSFSQGNSSTVVDVNIPHGIINFGRIVSIDTTLAYVFPMPTLAGIDQLSGVYNVDATNIIFRCCRDSWGTIAFDAVLRYVKS